MMCSRAAAVVAAFFLLLSPTVFAKSAKAKPSNAQNQTGAASPSSGSSGKAQLETYKDLIHKAQNLTLQRDRLQTSQVLVRALRNETKGSPAYKELTRALDDLTGVFYTEKAQNLFAVAEGQLGKPEQKGREAIDGFQEALRIEEGNVTVLKALVRAQLNIGECDKADASLKAAEGLNPYSAEVKLLRLQTFDCMKQWDALSASLASAGSDLEPVDKFTKGLVMKDLLRRKEFKKAKALITGWENQAPDYPEVHYWKWQLGQQTGVTDRASALKYTQLCQNLTPRRRKSFDLDVDLCKGKEMVDSFLKESGFMPSAPTGGAPNELND